MKIPAWVSIAATKQALGVAARAFVRLWTREQAGHIAKKKRERATELKKGDTE